MVSKIKLWAESCEASARAEPALGWDLALLGQAGLGTGKEAGGKRPSSSSCAQGSHRLGWVTFPGHLPLGILAITSVPSVPFPQPFHLLSLAAQEPGGRVALAWQEPASCHSHVFLQSIPPPGGPRETPQVIQLLPQGDLS